ncbi:hypothetical protein LTR70_007979 [Exophiala xenobiotica]|uniref:Uncharacterized protein n=1 Tax=Lithohypha guttulata TaxID=1690604 RepID=A0ABR0K1S7_9EURO|nr:hypothetical protein LTR24_007825 [Lithohypha guttulata]KAK5312812.1 hypothetical protein LTR70_007979 [Exophiala xenobiotica]
MLTHPKQAIAPGQPRVKKVGAFHRMCKFEVMHPRLPPHGRQVQVMTALRASKPGLQPVWRCPKPTVHLPPSCLRRSISRRSQSTLLEKAAPHLPRILQPSMWENIIPATFRSKSKELLTRKEKKPTNPATFFIWIYLLIGSQAIRIVQVKNDYATISRRSDLQLEKLREVVRKLQAGEEVDVDKVLGTGVPEEEEAWEEALREIQEEERVWTESKRQKRERKRMEKEQAEQAAREREDASPVNTATDHATTNAAPISSSNPPYTAPGFY